MSNNVGVVHVLNNVVWNYERKPLLEEFGHAESSELVWFLWELPKHARRVYHGYFQSEAEMLGYMRDSR